MGIVMIMRHENQFGYLLLYQVQDERGVLIKANKITSISWPLSGMSEAVKSVIYTDDNEMFYIGETVEQILEQLENIHPSLR
jgi:hypothetical protein